MDKDKSVNKGIFAQLSASSYAVRHDWEYAGARQADAVGCGFGSGNKHPDGL
jgi:hypothetical protein